MRRACSASCTPHRSPRSVRRSRAAPPPRPAVQGRGLGIAYVNSKHEGEVEALRLAAHGLDVVIVNPSFVLGPDDPKGTSMHLVRRFLLGRIPAYVEGGLNIVDVRDVAQGHLLADRKGETGERYILAGRNFTLDRLFADFARISGRDRCRSRSRRGRPRWRSTLSSGSGFRSLSRRTRSGRRCSGGPIATRRRGACSGSSRGLTRRRSRMRFDGRWTCSATECERDRGPQEAALAVVAPLLRATDRILSL